MMVILLIKFGCKCEAGGTKHSLMRTLLGGAYRYRIFIHLIVLPSKIFVKV